MKRKYTGASFMTSIVVEGIEEDVAVRGYVNERRQTCFEVSISNGTNMDIYWWTPNKLDDPLWFDCSTKKQTPLVRMVGRAIYKYCLENR